MKIGIDLDEVLVNFVSSFLVFYEGESGKNIPINHIKSYNFWENGVGKTREESVDRFFQSTYFDRLSIVSGAEKAVASLAQEGDIYVITARPAYFREKTESCLRKHFPVIKGNVVYTGDFHKGGRTKAEVCRQLGIGEFYEDNLDYARECARYVNKVFLFDRPWNQVKVNGNIIRVRSWREAMNRRRE